ncbi:MAG: hypothetical protein E5X21_05690, partial [Mesorhizobium sp.]
MQAVAAIEGGEQPRRVGGIGQRTLEIDDGIGFARCPDPGVHRLAVALLGRRVEGSERLAFEGATEGRQRAKQHLDAVEAGACDQLPVSRDQAFDGDGLLT